jgi:hypothetical protein
LRGTKGGCRGVKGNRQGSPAGSLRGGALQICETPRIGEAWCLALSASDRIVRAPQRGASASSAPVGRRPSDLRDTTHRGGVRISDDGPRVRGRDIWAATGGRPHNHLSQRRHPPQPVQCFRASLAEGSAATSSAHVGEPSGCPRASAELAEAPAGRRPLGSASYHSVLCYY